MPPVELKLKQASAVLGVAPKELQNLVQLKVLRPPRRDNLYWFDRRLLLELRINDQWRICFVWRDGDAFDVAIVDYH